MLSRCPIRHLLRIAWLQTLTHAAGVAGMCGGQAIDIDATGQSQTLKALEAMHALKSGTLMRAAVRMGALAGDPSAEDLHSWTPLRPPLD